MQQLDRLEIFEQVMQNNWVAVVFADLTGTVKYANSAAYELYGYDAVTDELIEEHVDIFNSRKTINTDEIVNDITTKGGWSGELIQRRKDNSEFTALLTVWLVMGADGQPIGMASNSKDITETKQTQTEMAASLREKEILLSEVHHRVKNNLQLISSLLNLQSSFINDKTVNNTLQNLQSRVRAMSLIHEKLYTSNLSRVSVLNYTKGLFETIISTQAGMVPIELEMDVDDTALEISKMLPLGLMLNELITNSIKHAFVGRPNGLISISLKEKAEQIQLDYCDNGVGLEHQQDEASSTTYFGTLLIDTFAEQLEGELEPIPSEQGVHYRLCFNRG